jgi:hypothetical protein
MATFTVQVGDLTTFGSTDDVALAVWLADGCKELINLMPDEMLVKVSGESGDFTPTGGTNVTSTIIGVTRKTATSGGNTFECREIPYYKRNESQDEDNVLYATETDPVYYIEPQSGTSANKIKVLPLSSSSLCNAVTVQYPTPAIGDEAISLFPDEAEYLVVLYASVKALQRLMNDLNSNSDITTALTVVNTELDDTQAVCDLVNTQLDSAVAEVALAKTEAAELATQTDNSGDFETALDAINTAVDKFQADGGDPALFGDETQYLTGVGLAHVKDALELARDAIDTGFTTDEDSGSSDDATPKSAGYWLDDEDTEMVDATVKVAQTELARAQTHIQEWSATVDALSKEIDGFSKEVASRAAFSGAKSQAIQGYLGTATTYIQSAQGFATEVQSRIGIAQGYIAEAGVRMQRDDQKYKWYVQQQTKLQQDYDKGIQLLLGVPNAQPQAQAQ